MSSEASIEYILTLQQESMILFQAWGFKWPMLTNLLLLVNEPHCEND